MTTDQFLRFSEVQKMFGISRSTLWRWHAERGLRVVNVGGIKRVRASDLELFISKHSMETPSDLPESEETRTNLTPQAACDKTSTDERS